MAKLNPPTAEYVVALRKELEDQYREQDRQIDDFRAMRELTKIVPIPSELRIVDIEVHDPTVTDEGQRVMATLSINSAKLSVVAGKDSDKAIENATLREHWTECVIEDAATQVPGVDARQALVDSVVNDGGGWWRVEFLRDTWDERYGLKLDDFKDNGVIDTKGYDQATEEAKKSAGQPLIIMCPDVRMLYPFYSGRRLAEMIEVQERPRLATFRQFRIAMNDAGEIVPDETGQGGSDHERLPTTVELVQHYDNTYCTYVVQAGTASRVVEQFEHKYRSVPFFFAPGQMHNYWRNRKVGWPIGYTKGWLCEYRSFLLTMLAQIGARDAKMGYTYERPETAAPIKGRDGQPPDRLPIPQMEIMQLEPGARLQSIIPAPVAESLKLQLQLTNELIDQLNTPRPPAEIGGGLEGAGFAINQLMTEAKVRHNPLAQNIERCYKDATVFIWGLVRNVIKEKVWVFHAGEKTGSMLAAGPDELADNVGIKWMLDPETPTAKLIEARYYNERVQAGTLSLDQSIEAQGGNPDEVRWGKMRDKIRASPEYEKMALDEVMRQVGRGDLLGQAAQQIAQTGMVPNATIPPAMGSQQVPDMGQLAMAPGGGMPMAPPPMPMGPPNGAVGGAGPGAVVPTNSAAAGIQQMGG